MTPVAVSQQHDSPATSETSFIYSTRRLYKLAAAWVILTASARSNYCDEKLGFSSTARN